MSKNYDLKKIKELINIMQENELLEVEIKHGDDKIFLKRSQPQPASGTAMTAVPIIPSNSPVTQTDSDKTQITSDDSKPETTHRKDALVEINSPLVGTFYSKPSPDSETYVELGSHVDHQTVVCIIEAMKVMNEIKADISGTIVEVLVDNGQAVEYGQVLFRVKPD